ncbi:MAG TPA: hypothetical protein VFF13_01220 [archaeon]|nr:hypothetical protein [archaeon]
MKNPIELLGEAFSLSINPASLFLGAIYFAIALLIGFGISTIAVVAGLFGIGALGLIENIFVKVAIIGTIALIAFVILIVIQAIMNIFALTGFGQILQRNTYNFEAIGDSVRMRVFPTIVAMLIVLFIYALVLGILAGVFYLPLKEVGLIIAFFVFLAFVFLTIPFFMLVSPTVVFENVGGIEAVGRAMLYGRRNYLFNLGTIVTVILLAIPMMLSFIIPPIGLLVSFFFTILYTIYIVKIYQENKARSI